MFPRAYFATIFLIVSSLILGEDLSGLFISENTLVNIFYGMNLVLVGYLSCYKIFFNRYDSAQNSEPKQTKVGRSTKTLLS